MQRIHRDTMHAVHIQTEKEKKGHKQKCKRKKVDKIMSRSDHFAVFEF